MPENLHLSLEQFQEEENRKLRSVQLARAYLQRAANAGIPDRFIRTDKVKFQGILCDNYHKNIPELIYNIYDNPKEIFKFPFILIDGGGMDSRKMAGYAVLFRMIVCDKFGLYQDCREIVHTLQSGIKTGFNRIEYMSSIKDSDALFIGEFSPNIFSPHMDTGTFFDELLSYRYDLLKPTIISFVQTLKDGSRIKDPKNDFNDMRCGDYLRALFQSPIDHSKIMHIRVKK